MKGKIFATFIFITLIFTYPNVSIAAGGFEFYLFGVKVDSFTDYNWLEVTAGAVSSLLVHELGHALYLERSGKDWDLRASSSGLAIYTNDNLSDNNCKNLGRAGFALQTAIGTVLTAFEITRRSDFVKGWVGTNSVQLYTYNFRSHNDGNDFQMIERGGGNPKMEQNIFAMLSLYNLSRLKPKQIKPVIPNYGIMYGIGAHYWDDITDDHHSSIRSPSNIDHFDRDYGIDYAALYPGIELSKTPNRFHSPISITEKLASDESSWEIKPLTLSQRDLAQELPKVAGIEMTAMLKTN